MPGEREPQVRMPDRGRERRLRQRALSWAIFQAKLGACRMDCQPQSSVEAAGEALAGRELSQKIDMPAIKLGLTRKIDPILPHTGAQPERDHHRDCVEGPARP